MESFDGRLRGENKSLFHDAANLWELNRLVARQMAYYDGKPRHATLGYTAPVAYIIQEGILPQSAVGLAAPRTHTGATSPPHVHNTPIEDLLQGEVGQSQCCSACGDSDSRTVTVSGKTYETIPVGMIVLAGLAAARRARAGQSRFLPSLTSAQEAPTSGSTGCSYSGASEHRPARHVSSSRLRQHSLGTSKP